MFFRDTNPAEEAIKQLSSEFHNRGIPMPGQGAKYFSVFLSVEDLVGGMCWVVGKCVA
jgi:hypothetical protein